MEHPQWSGVRDRVHRLLEHARDTVPHFSGILTGDLEPSQVTTYDRFCALPVMGKTMMQADPVRFLSQAFDPKDLHVEYTSGSTGVPFLSYKSARDVNASTLALWGGRRRFAPGSVGTRGAAFYAFLERQGGLVTDPVSSEGDMLYLSLFHMHDDRFALYWEAMVEFQPRWIVGTPTAVSQLAEYVLRTRPAERDKVKLLLAEIGGEVAFPGQYQVIREAFGCPVSMHYGARELWPIAYSCAEGALHVVDPHVLVEVLGPDRMPCPNGTPGTVHVTSLRYEALPLIRYDLGDLARLSDRPCPCGLPAPVLLLDGGRASQYIARPDGSRMSPVILFYILKQLSEDQTGNLHQFQMLQTGLDDFEVRVVAQGGWGPPVQERFRQELIALLGPVTVAFRRVDRISPDDGTGKTQFFFSHVH